ncbi:MAG: hypothetical protein RBR58_02220, partial [Candidatus Humimicrobiaceae bacterium]|nr:hypothetical protein [Candidatus Humimicrobiaceae bacterium]
VPNGKTVAGLTGLLSLSTLLHITTSVISAGPIVQPVANDANIVTMTTKVIALLVSISVPSL